jgi:hypothetical protein
MCKPTLRDSLQAAKTLLDEARFRLWGAQNILRVAGQEDLAARVLPVWQEADALADELHDELGNQASL